MTTEHQVALARQGRGASSHLSKAARKVVPAFLQKLYEMVNDPGSDEQITWSETGDSFYVLDHERLAHEVLGRWFKHNNCNSFVRQLNMYGFHKIPHLQQGVLKSDTETELWNFEHPHFRRGQPDMLCLIQRKKPPSGNIPIPEEQPVPPPRDPVNPNPPPPPLQNTPAGQVLDINSLFTGISVIKRHQQAISTDLNELKTSNQHLWQEAMAARERHKKHQDTINRILKFLAGVFGHSAASPVRQHDGSESPHPVIPRKQQRLMIADAGSEKPKVASVADEADEEDPMQGVETESQVRTPTPFATIATPSELFTPAETPTALPSQPASQSQNELASPVPQPSALTSFSSSRTDSPNTNELFQNALNQMMGSPQQMQRLLQALSQSSFPIQTQPAPPTAPASTGTELNNQLTQYAPPAFNFDTLPQHEDINSNRTVFLPLSPSQKSPPQLSSALAPLKADDLTPLFQEHDARLQKSWDDASHIAANVDLMDSNIKTFIDDLGFDPSMFTYPEFPTTPSSGDANGGGSLHMPQGMGDSRGPNEEATGDIDIDFEDLLTQFSRQNENDASYSDLSHQLASSAAIEDGETDQLTAFLDEVASDTASIRQHSPEAPLLRRKKRKSGAVDTPESPSLPPHKAKRSR